MSVEDYKPMWVREMSGCEEVKSDMCNGFLVKPTSSIAMSLTQIKRMSQEKQLSVGHDGRMPVMSAAFKIRICHTMERLGEDVNGNYSLRENEAQSIF